MLSRVHPRRRTFAYNGMSMPVPNLTISLGCRSFLRKNSMKMTNWMRSSTLMDGHREDRGGKSNVVAFYSNSSRHPIDTIAAISPNRELYFSLPFPNVFIYYIIPVERNYFNVRERGAKATVKVARRALTQLNDIFHLLSSLSSRRFHP